MKFRHSIMRISYILAAYLTINYISVILETWLNPLMFPGAGFPETLNLPGFLPYVIILFISKILLDRMKIEVQLLQYLYILGVYKILNGLLKIVNVFNVIIRYNQYPSEQILDHIKLQTIDITFNVVIGMALILIGYRIHQRKTLESDGGRY